MNSRYLIIGMILLVASLLFSAPCIADDHESSSKDVVVATKAHVETVKHEKKDVTPQKVEKVVTAKTETLVEKKKEVEHEEEEEEEEGC